MWKITPYWWFRRDLPDGKPLEIADYALARHVMKNGNIVEDTDTKYVEDPDPKNAIKHHEVTDWLYSALTILDSKASALMRLNGVMVAAAAFLLKPDFTNHGHWYIRMAVPLSALLSTLSISFCLLVVCVDWPFMGLVERSGHGTTDPHDTSQPVVYDFRRELYHLQNCWNFRQFWFRCAWFISMIAAIFFFVAMTSFSYDIVMKGCVNATS